MLPSRKQWRIAPKMRCCLCLLICTVSPMALCQPLNIAATSPDTSNQQPEEQTAGSVFRYATQSHGPRACVDSRYGLLRQSSTVVDAENGNVCRSTTPAVWPSAQALTETFGGKHSPLGVGPRFLVFESWGAGWNNERMSLEMAFVLALLWGRTLVLPPCAGIPSRTEAQFKYEDFYDLGTMKRAVEGATDGTATVLTASEFLNLTLVRPSLFTGLAEQGSHKTLGARSPKQPVLELREKVSRLQPVKSQKSTNSRAAESRPAFKYGRHFHGIDQLATVVLADHEVTSSVINADWLQIHQNDDSTWPSLKEFATRKRPRISSVPSNVLLTERVVFIPPARLLGNYYTTIWTTDGKRAKRVYDALQTGLRLRDVFWDRAETAVSVLQKIVNEAMMRRSQIYGGYSVDGVSARSAVTPAVSSEGWWPWISFHNRQGDFAIAYPNHWLNASDQLQRDWFVKTYQNLLGKAAAIYYATNSVGMTATQDPFHRADSELLKDLKGALIGSQNGIIVEWSDIKGRIMPVVDEQTGYPIPEWVTVIEMLICVHAENGFIGSFGSTFTGYVHRLRTWSTLTPNAKEIYFSKPEYDGRVDKALTHRGEEPAPSWAHARTSSAIVWGREWSECSIN